MNEKGKLQEMYEAIGKVLNPKKEVETVVEAETAQEETVEAVAEVTEPVLEPETEAKAEDVPEAVEEPKEEAAEPEVQAVEEADDKDVRIKELERQIEGLTDMFKSFQQPEEEAVPDLPVEEPKGLTHSPEAEVASKRVKIAGKGKSIQESVYRYMNN